MEEPERACAGPACARLIRPVSARNRFCSRSCSEKAAYRGRRGVVRTWTAPAGPVITPLLADIAWSAGFLDGEGAFQVQARRVGRCKTRYVVAAAQVVREPLDRLLALWGGRLEGPSRGDGRRSPIYQWTVSGSGAAAMVRAIRPFLLVKSRQADLMLAYAALPGAFEKGYTHGRELRPEDVASRRAITRLNQRGVDRVGA